MPSLNRELVGRYIESAELFAASEAERKMIRLASEINWPTRYRAPLGRARYRRYTEERHEFKSKHKSKSRSGKLPETFSRFATKKTGIRIRALAASADEPVEADGTTRSWQRLIRKEIHLALCTRSARYRKYVDAINHNVHLLIGAIAVSVAGQLGLAVTVVAALVAALLRLTVSMGVAVFCKKFAEGQL